MATSRHPFGTLASANVGGQNITMRDKRFEEIVDAIPEFAIIPKGQLAVDKSYQRGLSDKRVKEIASNWSWAACGALKIALRPDGEWKVFDGQHRLAGAMLRPDVDGLPCVVYEMRTIAEEARGYLAQNAARAMTIIDRFRAMLITKDPHATAIQVLCTATNITVRSGVKPGVRAIGCAGELLKWAERDPTTLRRIWPLLIGVIERGGMVSDRLLRGLMVLEQRMPAGESLADRRWQKRLSAISYGTLVDAVGNAVLLEGSVSDRSCAIGLLAALNRGLKNRLTVPGLNG